MEKRIIDWFTIKSNIRRGLGEFLYNKTGRKPYYSSCNYGDIEISKFI
jgi:Predicted hydrolase of the metallo-beta-lactamase superfamily